MSITCDSEDASGRQEVLCKDSRDIETLPPTQERSTCSAVGRGMVSVRKGCSIE